MVEKMGARRPTACNRGAGDALGCDTQIRDAIIPAPWPIQGIERGSRITVCALNEASSNSNRTLGCNCSVSRNVQDVHGTYGSLSYCGLDCVGSLADSRSNQERAVLQTWSDASTSNMRSEAIGYP